MKNQILSLFVLLSSLYAGNIMAQEAPSQTNLLENEAMVQAPKAPEAPLQPAPPVALKPPAAPKAMKAHTIPSPPSAPELNKQAAEPTGKMMQEVDEMPQFPGCEQAEKSAEERSKCSQEKLVQYIGENLKYPSGARKAGTQGTVIMSFVVNESGSLENVEVVRDIGDGCGDAGLAVFQKMNSDGIQWIPGKHEGKVVKVEMKLPITFKL